MNNPPAIIWKQGRDEHRWTAEIGEVYKLRVSPSVSAYGVRYDVEVCNWSLVELASEVNLPTVELAKHSAIFLAWNHNFIVYDTLLVGTARGPAEERTRDAARMGDATDAGRLR